MQAIKEKVLKFLEKYEMDYERVDLNENCKIFMEEMQKGLDAKDSSLMMIPTYISMDKELPLNEPVIVIDAGGTNFRVAVVHFDNEKKPVIEDFKLYSMPGIEGEISKDELFDTMASYVQPVFHKSDKIGFCFSYPTQIMPNKDGRLIKFSKEVKVRDVEGEAIGENLLKSLKKMGCNESKKVILLNDTVSTLLGGKASFPDRAFDSYIGFILGTGTNTCYLEKNSNIGKVEDLKNSEGSMLINIESGDYKKFQTGIIDKEFDSETVNPGSFIFEKSISGAYQGKIILAVIKKASQDGLFSKKFIENLSLIKDLSSKEIDDFLYYPFENNTLAKCCKTQVAEDSITLFHIIDAILERAAKYVTFNLTAVILKTGKGKNPCMPVCITADGSTFYKSKIFKSKLDYYIRTFSIDQKQIYFDFVKAENGTLIGTAIAALLN